MLTRAILTALSFALNLFAIAAVQADDAATCWRPGLPHQLGYELRSHLLGEAPVILIDDESLDERDRVEVEMLIDRSGVVTCTHAIWGPKSLWPQATALAKALRFRPFERDGRPVEVWATDYVDLRWANQRPTVRVPFPEITDWKSLRIRLERLGGFMSPTAYDVEISGTGRVAYHGQGRVAVKGARTDQISPTAVTDLVARFRDADFFWLHNTYSGQVEDLGYIFVSISFDGRVKRVRCDRGALPLIEALADRIDTTANTRRWVGEL